MTPLAHLLRPVYLEKQSTKGQSVGSFLTPGLAAFRQQAAPRKVIVQGAGKLGLYRVPEPKGFSIRRFGAQVGIFPKSVPANHFRLKKSEAMRPTGDRNAEVDLNDPVLLIGGA